MWKSKEMRMPVVLALAGLALLVWPAVAVTEDGESENPGFLAARGRITYGRYCANCHGPDAKGGGSIAKFLKIPPADLTQIEPDENGEFPYERLRAVIDGRTEVRGHGARDMPIWGDVFQDPLSERYASGEESGEERAERMIRELIYFLETLQAGSGSEAAGG